MATEAQLAAAFILAFLTALAATPVAIRVARRTAFYDHPEGYKAHLAPTPYLGGAAVLSAVAVGALIFADGHGRFGPVVAGAVGLWVVGTIDDRRTLRPSYRLIATAAATGLLWSTGLGWSVFELDLANLAFTVLWVVAVVNALNLMDNIDGAMSAVACASGGGIALLALLASDFLLAGLALSVCGAMLGFLRFNLASPARVFLGDGGSMPVGFVLAAGVMSLSFDEGSGWRPVIAGALLVGLPAFDTTLVILSRYRRGATIWAGGRDHVTHRLLAKLGSTRAVVLILAVVQAALCVLAVTVAIGNGEHALVVIAACLATGVVCALLLEIEPLALEATASSEAGSRGLFKRDERRPAADRPYVRVAQPLPTAGNGFSSGSDRLQRTPLQDPTAVGDAPPTLDRRRVNAPLEPQLENE